MNPEKKWSNRATFFLCVGGAGAIIYPIIRLVSVKPVATPFAFWEYCWMGFFLLLIVVGVLCVMQHFSNER